MKQNYTLFTSESVTEGHPDKVCDRISDSVLDAVLERDPVARVACETIVTTGMVFVMGEMTTTTYVDIAQIVRKTLSSIGYNRPEYGFDGRTCAVLTALDDQSPDISQGVTQALEGRKSQAGILGAGDQGMMFGYATNESAEYMPMPILLAHKLTQGLARLRHEGVLPYLRPDGKAQVTVAYDEDSKPKFVHTIVVSTQHDAEVSLEQIREDIKEHLVKQIIPPELLTDELILHVNPTGRFVLGGPQADSGLSGRKIICDTYGGMASHGGGSFSGKDPTKVDRSGAYAARYVAKNLVASGLCERCEVQIAYAIGLAKPVSIHVDSFGTSQLSNAELAGKVEAVFDLTPGGIIKHLQLNRPIYAQISNYGHFGRNELDLPWEQTDKIQELLEA